MKPDAKGVYKHLLSIRTFAENLRRRTTGLDYNVDEVNSMLIARARAEWLPVNSVF